MALYIAPIVTAVQGILTNYMPALLEGTGFGPFMCIGQEFTWIMNNPPEAWVMGVRTQIDDSGNSLYEQHDITIKFGVIASDPGDIPASAFVYMKAISDAIAAAQPADWAPGPIPNHAHVVAHDYGPLFVFKSGGLARFPEAHLEVEVNEIG
jgi:hypothetical protein